MKDRNVLHIHMVYKGSMAERAAFGVARWRLPVSARRTMRNNRPTRKERGESESLWARSSFSVKRANSSIDLETSPANVFLGGWLYNQSPLEFLPAIFFGFSVLTQPSSRPSPNRDVHHLAVSDLPNVFVYASSQISFVLKIFCSLSYVWIRRLVALLSKRMNNYIMPCDALADASRNGVAHEAVQSMKKVSKTMTESEARQILGVSENAP
ncbi:unnamed protein product [Linum tenue]|uniref:Uncharacterized protein n=1 Tax=Linum tenue TaxID=586396 RepID=A0AAV0RPX7_9ROSI|nr:unnamed protein product [Linum tenue]